MTIVSKGAKVLLLLNRIITDTTEAVFRVLCSAVIVVLLVPSVLFADTQPIPVGRMNTPPVVDGNLDEWGADGWNKVTVKPAMEDDKLNFVGTVDVDFKAVTSEGHIYIAARWPDGTKDLQYKNWVWRSNKYKRDKKLDDIFAVRFHMSGDYDTTMLSEKTYTVDVWVWTAGRSNPTGIALDAWHHISLDLIEYAAEYELPSGKIVFIKKNKDEGTPSFHVIKPKHRKKFEGKKLPSIGATGKASGSVADVHARGVWKDGHWHLEFKRRIDIQNKDDVTFKPGMSLMGAIAVYNRSELEHKSVSGDLLFEFQ